MSALFVTGRYPEAVVERSAVAASQARGGSAAAVLRASERGARH